MFYEEQVINGVLCCRSAPNGEWREATTTHARAVNELLALSDEKRTEAFAFFCTHCGAADPRCQCWNDD
jgi:hypothetical protein